MNFVDVIDVLMGLFILCGLLVFICFDNGLEFVVKVVRDWIFVVGVNIVYIESGFFWENGFCESFNG